MEEECVNNEELQRLMPVQSRDRWRHKDRSWEKQDNESRVCRETGWMGGCEGWIGECL